MVQCIRIPDEVIWLGIPGDISRSSKCRSNRVFLYRRNRELMVDSLSTDSSNVQLNKSKHIRTHTRCDLKNEPCARLIISII